MYRERVIILYDNSEPERKALKGLPSQQDTMDEVGTVEEALSKAGFKSRRLEIVYDRFETVVQELFRYQGDIVFNLCEDIKGEGIYEPYMAALLELLGFDYTGSGPLTLGFCLDKAKTQKLLSVHGLPTPRHVVLERGDETIPKGLYFPLIVKLLHEDGSLGLDKGSVVFNKDSLMGRVKKMIREYQEPVIAEEYIEGREFNISILGNGKEAQILPIAEIDHSAAGKNDPKILTYASKWDESSQEYQKTMPICPTSLSPSLEKSLRSVARAAFQILGCRDYARVDVRLRGKTPYIIEVNPNPCISLDAGFIRSATVAGLSYADVIGKIVEFAVLRKRTRSTRKAHPWIKEKRLAAS